jgi:HIV Tat-specific factor 1
MVETQGTQQEAPTTTQLYMRMAYPNTIAATVHLDSLFLYQNNVTGEVSKTHLTTRQLCRILCPPATTTNAPIIRHLTADTNLLLQEPDGSYCTEAGWMPAKDVPVLRETVAMWYYYAVGADTRKADDVPASPVVGPAVSCRSLASIVKGLGSVKHLYFSSSLTRSEWMTIDQLDDLRTALEAFDELAAPGHDVTPLDVTATLVPDATPSKRAAVSDLERELELFLHSSTDRSEQDENDDKEESYDSDGGTRYVKDLRTGNWVHEALAKRAPSVTRNGENSPLVPALKRNAESSQQTLKRKQKKSKFSSKKSRCWIYVTGLPDDCTAEEIAERFSKAGLLDLDPETQQPKIKMYRHRLEDVPNGDQSLLGKPKGDASICYARPESVDLAIALLDGTPFRATISNDNSTLMQVQAAKFEQHGEEFIKNRGIVSNAKRKVAKLAAMQAVDWDEGEFNGRLTGGRKGLHIVVVKHLFDAAALARLSDEKQHDFLQALDDELRLVCEEWGDVDKLTFFSKNPDGVAVVKFALPGAASDAVRELGGRPWKGGVIAASFWDGVTDYTVKDEECESKDAERREEEFGSWLESQELPEELRLKTD